VNGIEMNRIINILAFALLLSSCADPSIDFKKESWNERSDLIYSNRSKMLRSLLADHLTEGMTRIQVTQLLGRPENWSNIPTNEIGYEIEVDYGWNIDPVKGKNLLLQFSDDSLLTNITVLEWGK